MGTTELTQVGQGTASRQGRPQRRGLVALIVGAALAAAIAIGAVEMRSDAQPAPVAPSPVQLSIAPGHTQPAALIHRISARPTQQDRNG
jgi:hypothetical protein